MGRVHPWIDDWAPSLAMGGQVIVVHILFKSFRFTGFDPRVSGFGALHLNRLTSQVGLHLGEHLQLLIAQLLHSCGQSGDEASRC